MAEKGPRLVSAIDESGSVLCHYSYDELDGNWRAIPPKKTTASLAKQVLDVFLPAGYPHTVTADYMPYQIYAFSSAIAGLMSSRAVMESFGVGNSDSSATSAVLLSVLQEATGRLATIMFAHRFGQAIEPECKYYRFLADILNDSAILLGILTPALPYYSKVMALCAAGVLRSLCGVAAGAAKASLSAHFAKNGNLAELNAKDGSQETIISLMGMLTGSVVVRIVKGRTAVWICMIALIAVHLWTNYQAVRAVQMRTLNRQRAEIVINEYLRTGSVLNPAQTAARERILTWKPPKIQFACTFPRTDEIGPYELETFKTQNHVITDRDRTIYLKQRAKPRDALTAYMAALCEVNSLALKGAKPPAEKTRSINDEFWAALASAGWNLDSGALETGPAVRIVVRE